METLTALGTIEEGLAGLVEAELSATGGLLRLAPCWVPRVFLRPGGRLKLHPDDLYAYGLDRGGIDERCLPPRLRPPGASRTPYEGLSYVVVVKNRFTLRRAVEECGSLLVGESIWSKYKKWPVYAKFFDNAGPIPHHMHQSTAQAALVGEEGKPEAYYFPAQLNRVENAFPYTFMGLEPGTSKRQVRKCLEDWNKGDNRILELSRAYRLKIGSGWLIDPCILHAPGSLCTYEPQWGSDVFAMYQNLVEGRQYPWSFLAHDMPREHHQDLDFIVDQLNWEKNVDPNFKDNHYLEPVLVADTQAEGYDDRWITYGQIDGEQLFTAKELTIDPGVKATIRDAGAYALVCIQGLGKINRMALNSPTMIRFDQLTEDEYFVCEEGAKAGIVYENCSENEPLVILRYFGPEANPDAPSIGAHKAV